MNSFKKLIITLWAHLIILSLSAQYDIDPNYGFLGTFLNPVENIEFIDIVRSHEDGQFIISQIGEDYAFPFIAKVSPEGILDTTFHTDGALIQWFMDDRRIVDLTKIEYGDDLGIYTLYQGNDTTDINDDLLVMKFLPDGEIDTTWSEDGLVQITPPDDISYDYEYHSVTGHIFPAIFVTGIRRAAGLCDEVFVYALDEYGNKMLSFGDDGLLVIDINNISGSAPPLCNYSVKGVNEKGGTFVVSLENSLGESSFCLARSNNLNGTVDPNFADLFLDSDLDYFSSEGFVFINHPLLFEDMSHNIVEQAGFLDWFIPFKQDNVSLLHYYGAPSQLDIRSNLDLPSDATYSDLTTKKGGAAGITPQVYLTGSRNNMLHMAAVSLCDDDYNSIQLTDLDLSTEDHTGLYIVNQNEIGSTGQDSLVVLYGTEGITSTYTMSRLLGSSSCTETGIDDIDITSSVIQISPNPVTDSEIFIAISNEGSSIASIQLTAIDGRAHHILGSSMEVDNMGLRLSLPEDIIPGMYILSLENDIGIYTSKLVIQ